jgi:hypothetical protein
VASTKRPWKGRLRKHRAWSAWSKSVDPVTSARIEFALSTLAASGKLKGARTARLSARIDPGLMQAARAKAGLNNGLELVNARLPKDFELEL